MTNPSETQGRQPRFLTDECFNLEVVAGLRRREADIEIAQEALLLGSDDPEILTYAKAQDRILLAHDVNTMPSHFARFVQNLSEGEHTPGVMYLAQLGAIGVAIEAIYLVWTASTHDEWRDQETRLPM